MRWLFLEMEVSECVHQEIPNPSKITAEADPKSNRQAFEISHLATLERCLWLSKMKDRSHDSQRCR